MVSVWLLVVLSVLASLLSWVLRCIRLPPRPALHYSGLSGQIASTTPNSIAARMPPQPSTNTYWDCLSAFASAPPLQLVVYSRQKRHTHSTLGRHVHGRCSGPVQSCRTAQFLHSRFLGSADLCVHSRHFCLYAKRQVVWAYRIPFVQSANSPRHFALFRSGSPIYCKYQLHYKGGFHNVRNHSSAAAAKAWPPETSQKPDCKTLPHDFVQFTT